MWPFSRSKAAPPAGRPAAVPRIDVREAYRRTRAGAHLIDVRSAGEFGTGHPRLARHVPPELIARGAAGLEPHDEVLVICQSGHRSARAAKALAAQGFTNVSDVSGGLAAWRKAGLPVDK